HLPPRNAASRQYGSKPCRHRNNVFICGFLNFRRLLRSKCGHTRAQRSNTLTATEALQVNGRRSFNPTVTNTCFIHGISMQPATDTLQLYVRKRWYGNRTLFTAITSSLTLHKATLSLSRPIAISAEQRDFYQ